jgi:hypothetical protein
MSNPFQLPNISSRGSLESFRSLIDQINNPVVAVQTAATRLGQTMSVQDQAIAQQRQLDVMTSRKSRK